MATEVYAGPLGAIRTASKADGGTALKTVPAFIPLPTGTVWASITPRNFEGAKVVKLAFNPWLWVFKTTDGLVLPANVTTGSYDVQDGDDDTSLSLSALNTATNLDFVYVGSSVKFRGTHNKIGGKNTNAAALTIKYWTGAAWGTLASNDNTSSGGKTFITDGEVTWTDPDTWAKDSIVNIQAILTVTDADIIRSPASQAEPLFWTRWQTSAAFASGVTLTEMWAMNNNTTQYAELLPGQTIEQRIHTGAHGIGCIEALTDAGTADLIVNVAAGSGGFG